METLVPTLDPVLDLTRSGARHGWGVFETLRLARGRALRLPLHLERLAAGTAFLGLPPPPAQAEIEALLARLPRPDDGILRLQAVDRSLILSAAPLDDAPALPATLDLADSLVRLSSSPLNRFKTLAYLENRLLAREAEARGLTEVVALNERGEVTDGSRTTLLLVRGGALLTPPAAAGALPGVARRVILEAGLAREAVLLPGDLEAADALFLASSLRGILPVATYRGRARTVPGDLLAALRALLD